MNVFEGMEQKFTVVKNEDIQNHLTESERQQLNQLLWKVDQSRFHAGKSVNVYLVVNIDEPYAPDVVSILKDYGHWGSGDPNQLEASIVNDQLMLPTFEMGD
jgi:hypothetical protein